jgi:hypothetical protein
VSINIKTSFKLAVLFVLGILLLISLTLLIYKSHSNKKRSAAYPTKSSDPKEIKEAERILESLLIDDKFNCIKVYRETGGYLEIKVEGSSWRDLSIKNKKAFLKDLTSARTTLGLIPDVKVIDYRSSIELASSEHGRVILGEVEDSS